MNILLGILIGIGLFAMVILIAELGVYIKDKV